jgi:hypothetical protein
VDAQPVPKGDTEARQQKPRREMQHSIYFEISDAILATYV